MNRSNRTLLPAKPGLSPLSETHTFNSMIVIDFSTCL